MTLLSTRRLPDLLKWTLPFLLWGWIFLDFFLHQNSIGFDTLASYYVVKFYINNLLNGVFPLWDPYIYGGSPFYSLVVMGLFNPLVYLMALLVGLGVNYYDAFLIFLIGSFWVGCLGFYFLAKVIWRDRRFAYLAFLLLLFSGVGGSVWTQFNMFLIFVPSVWFFYFLFNFLQSRQPRDLLALSVFSGILATSYLPFHFVTVFLLLSLFGAVFYWQRCKEIVIRLVPFFQKNKTIAAVACLTVLISLLPLIFFRLSDGTGETVNPARHCSNKDRNACIQDTLKGDPALSFYETTVSGSLGERVDWQSQFQHQDKFSFSTDDLFFLPMFGYLAVFLSFAAPFNRRSFFLLTVSVVLFLISCGEAAGVYRFLYDHVFFFKYFRNLFFFMIFLMPLLILFAVDRFKVLVETIHSDDQRVRAGFVLGLHLLFLFFLIKLGDVLPSVYLTVLLSFLFFLFLGFKKDKVSPKILYALLLAAVLLHPVDVLSRFSKNAGILSCQVSGGHSAAQFSFTRPTEAEDLQCPMIPFRSYIGDFWHEGTMRDAPVRIEAPGAIARGVFYLSYKMQPDFFAEFVRHKFVIFDRVKSYSENDEMLVQMAQEFQKKGNTAFVEDPELVDRFDQSQKGGQAIFIEGKSENFQVQDFNVNAIKFQTDFSDRKFLVYYDAFHSRWKARMNGKKAKVYQANGAFKGIELPPGLNDVEFVFAPPGGAWIYLLTLLYLGFVSLWAVRLFLQTPDLREPSIKVSAHKGTSSWLPNSQLKKILFAPSGLVFLLIGMLLIRGVDWRKMQENRMHYLLGIFLKGEPLNYSDGALYFYKKILLEPRNDTAYAGLGICLLNLRQYPAARNAYRKAIQLNPGEETYRAQLLSIENKISDPSAVIPETVLKFEKGKP